MRCPFCFQLERVTDYRAVGKPGCYIGLCNNKSHNGGCGAADLGAVGVGTPRRGVRANKIDGRLGEPSLPWIRTAREPCKAGRQESCKRRLGHEPRLNARGAAERRRVLTSEAQRAQSLGAGATEMGRRKAKSIFSGPRFCEFQKTPAYLCELCVLCGECF